MAQSYTTIRLTSASAEKIKLIRSSYELLKATNLNFDDMVDKFTDLVLENDPKVSPILRAALVEHGYLEK